MAMKKASAKESRSRKMMLDTDPPILVGGGGSSLIWILKELEPQLIDPATVNPNAPKPKTPGDYYCFRVQGSVTKIDVDDGTGGGPGGPKPANGKKFHIQFDF